MEAVAERPRHRKHPHKHTNQTGGTNIGHIVDIPNSTCVETVMNDVVERKNVTVGNDGDKQTSETEGTETGHIEDIPSISVETVIDNADERESVAVGNVGDVGASAAADLSDDKSELVHEDLKELDEKLSEQEIIFKGEKLRVLEKKEQCIGKVEDLFKELKAVLNAKRVEILCKIDGEFDGTANFMEDVIASIAKDRTALKTRDKSSDVDRQIILNEVYVEHDARDDIFTQMKIPEFKVNDTLPFRVENLDYGVFENIATDSDITGSVTRQSTQDIDSIPESSTYGATFLGQYDENYSASWSRDNIDANPVVGMPTSPTVQARAAPVPSAPLIEERADESRSAAVADESEDPPPYWQAIGLSAPEGPSNQSQQAIPSYQSIGGNQPVLPQNELKLWHSFPIRRQTDRQQPQLTALLWNDNWICVGDRANMKVKFFYPKGQLVSEVLLLGYKIADVAFLESLNGECRYLVTCPQHYTLIIIFVKEGGSTGIVSSFRTLSAYNCVSRGPQPQTLVGGQAIDETQPPRVEIINFKGEILNTIKFTPSMNPLSYPRSVNIWGSKIVISDWGLSTVMTVLGDGTNIGEYRGSPVSPLCSPIDITFDNFGNIMIMDGELGNVHVCDIHGTPIEVIKVPKLSETTNPKLIAFEEKSKRLAISKANGDIMLFSFKDGYHGLPQGQAIRIRNRLSGQPDVLPLVEGMLPSTIESIGSRHPSRNRHRQFHL
ncbi:uncharacterized protein LOC128238688 isoform X1 [Mya arenaria]|uniref:uncharacterized protein LOC128238688 isoform X1 n=1 Tax=Mya arenaria TaxID=6604 RepID=UPI0022E9339F|nr:uncharacterized protein LOC128238688 isoform X1 [Mya arenaria]XP_052810788.1 uncharacterized protein LOC128238688 isoform X1 [Mya arenaria]XP_052810789.1 uncharacterized protein LOC128238688 isoform X1 [Mya arenaria]XP_052810790.1 uncharacterized protein LOC128238688 isoform X1 [Mya arenaria]